MCVILLLEVSVSNAFFVAAVTAILIMALMIFVALFDPGLRYKISAPKTGQLDSEDFLYILEAVTDAKVNHRTSLQVLSNGDQFYEAELRDISAAVRNINLEAYIFQRGEIAERFLSALADRARAGVKVSLLIDALGSARTTGGYLGAFKDAGGRVGWYNPARWNKLPTNDEVNLAVRDAGLNDRLEQDFVRDLANSSQLTYESWRRRPVLERAPELLGWVLERQQ